MRLVKSCEWLPQPVQDYKPIPLPLPNDESPLITTDQNLNGPSAAKVCGLDVYLLCCFSMAQATCRGQYIVACQGSGVSSKTRRCSADKTQSLNPLVRSKKWT